MILRIEAYPQIMGRPATRCSEPCQCIASSHAGNSKGTAGSVLDVPAAYVAREGVAGVCLARASVDELPFENAVFEAVICSGALQLFPDTLVGADSLRSAA